MLAYVAGRSLLVADADGRRARVVARAALEIYGPQWSSDSKRIVYSAGGALADSLDLFVVTVSTRRVVRLIGAAGNDVDPAWSPDGKTIAYIHQPPADVLGALVIVRANGTGRRTLLSNPGYSAPAWSPDSTRLAVVRGVESAAEIFTLTRDGEDLRRVTRNRYADGEPDWRPSQNRSP